MKNIFSSIFSFVSPVISFTIVGNSMHPLYKPGERVVVIKKEFFPIKIGNVVVLKDPRNGTIILKRVSKMKSKLYFVVGDNSKESTDSRQFGWIRKKYIIGKVLYVFHSL